MKRLGTSFALAIAAILAAAVLALSAPSRPPIPKPRPDTIHVQQAGQSQRRTDEAPLVVQPKNTRETQAGADQDKEQRAADDMFWLGVGQLVVGVGQTIALVVTFLIIAYVAVRQLRAYVYPDVSGLRAFSLASPIEVGIVWKNFGQTPARNFEANGVVWIDRFPLADDVKINRPKERDIAERNSRAALYPGMETRADYASTGVPVSEAVIKAIIAKQLAIYVVAEASYRDVFGITRRSQLCRYIHCDDAAELIRAELDNAELRDFEVRFIAAHVLNDFK